MVLLRMIVNILSQETNCSTHPPALPMACECVVWPFGFEVGFQENIMLGGMGTTCMVRQALSLGSEDLSRSLSLVFSD